MPRQNLEDIANTIRPSRFRHTAIIGQAGSGKTNLLNQLIQFDIESDYGLVHFDLSGTDTNTILRFIPKRRIKDVVLLDFADTDFPVSVNPFAGTGSDYDTVIADQLVDAFKSLSGYEDTATPDMDRTIYNAARVVIDLPGGTILDMYRMLIDQTVRDRVVRHARDPIVRNYWQDQFSRLDRREQDFITKSTVNKLEPFVSDRRIRNALGQPKPKVDLHRAIENRQIILISIPQSGFGLTKAKTVAGLILAQFQSIAQQRKGLLPFHVYLPEAQYFAGQTLLHMLSTLGQRSISITLSMQYLAQLGKLRDGVFGNIGNWIMFRSGLTDALELEKLFEWDNTRKLLHELNLYEARVAAANEVPYSCRVKKHNYPQTRKYKEIIKRSRHFYARPVSEIEGGINNQFGGERDED